MTEQTTENDVDGIADGDNGRRLDASENAGNHENFSPENEEFQEEYEEEKEIASDVDERVESSIWGQELGEYEGYEGRMYGERSMEDEEMEEGKSAPSSATITAAEKSEEEVRDVAGPDHVLAEIPAEVRINLSFTIILPAELLCLTTFTQEKVTPTYATKEPEQMEQIYRQTLLAYKLRLDDVNERKERAAADTRSYEDEVRATGDESARMFDELLDREREVATGLVYAKTGRKLTEKTVDTITRRQVSRRESLGRDRYECTMLQQRLEEINTRLRSLETLGEGMTTMDYEARHIAHLSYKDKLEEREREVEKLRQRIAEVVNEIAHYKEKEQCLAGNIGCEIHELNEYHERTVRIREDVNELYLILRDLRRARDEKRRDAGLLMAQPVLRETERTMKSMDALRNDIEIIKQEIQRHGPAYRGEKTASVMS
ncbi:PREDICTED: uncharacterized protein LOC106747299 [Dinoponera quadriceps]|uniref:Uncharacterized protein LOC106747299 n=1 Tax=Dinoponera quadriceps TaxID=609295 RepID=A0A6P3XNV7_DINQU|nr:PREDICTED: uncharacterized protein LOC106747299 [Dinoponera quadriceps]